MERVDADEDDNLGRLRRFECLCEVIELAVREADAYRRLENALQRELF